MKTLNAFLAEADKEPGKVTPKEFHHMLKDHDWTYQYSDDHRYWTAGEAAVKKHAAIVKNQPALKPIHDAWLKHKAGHGPAPKEPKE